MNKEIPLTLDIDGTEYILSQVRLCRNCGKEVDMHSNYHFKIDKANRIVLLEHQYCRQISPELQEYPKINNYEQLNREVKIMSAEEKNNFLYGDK